ncbi:hypothetical protein CA51_05350 [Rosistilla oblonga]|uniref:hypothetical protein n=1 Tax=Rosistilla oblonga TaxID=2527990 RepID=UPI00118981EB|nr:hypothetical protein [Rosistilla oblonga]QDV10684.1 hypothetical protein CA51_05350 [Rosistilla oblonga]
MHQIAFATILVLCSSIFSPTALAGRSITLFNEIDEKTGHDNHMVAVELFGDRAEITYCHGTDIVDILPLIRFLQDGSDHAITLRRVHIREIDVERRGWVIVWIFNRIKDSAPSILVYSSNDVSQRTAMSIGRSFRAMRKVPVVYRSRDELMEFYTDETTE